MTDILIADPLTDAQEAFCQAYVQRPMLRHAYRIAYPDQEPGNHDRDAFHLIRDPRIIARINTIRAQLDHAVFFDKGDLLGQVHAIALSDITDIFNADTQEFLPMDQWPQQARAAISSIEVHETIKEDGIIRRVAKVKLWNKVAALELGMKVKGMIENDPSNLPEGGVQVHLHLESRPWRREENDRFAPAPLALPPSTSEEG